MRVILVFIIFTQSIVAAPNTLYEHGNPTNLEQYMLELINRSRMDPTAEGIFLDTLDTWYTQDARKNKPEFFTNLRQEFANYPKVQPVAFNELLSQIALLHAEDMVDRDYFSHYTPEGLAPWDRAEKQGYINGVSENIDGGGAENAEDILASHFGFMVDHYNLSHDTSPLGHRINMLGVNHNEVGIGIYGPRNDGHIVQNFGTEPGRIYLVGVIYEDKNANNFYDPGEGLPDITITPSEGEYFAITSSSGGYAIPFDATEIIDVGAVDTVLQPNSDWPTDVKPVADAFEANYRSNQTDLTTISVTIAGDILSSAITKTVAVFKPTLVKYRINQTDNGFWPQEFTVGENAKLDFAISIDSMPMSPNAAISATQGENFLTVNLDASNSIDADGSIIDYTWTASDGQESSGVNSSIIFTQAGTYTITLTLTDNDGLTATAQDTVTVFDSIPTTESPTSVQIEFTKLQDSYQVGEKIVMELTETANRDTNVDLWVAVALPSDEFIFRTNDPVNQWNSIPQPYKTSINKTETKHYVFEFELQAGMGGDYIFYAAYVKEGEDPVTNGLSILSNLVIQQITLAND